MRAYELARVLGVTSRELLAFLRARNFEVWNALESLTDDQVVLARSLHPSLIKREAVPQAWREHHESFEDWHEHTDWHGRLVRRPPRQVIFTREAAHLVGVRPATIRQWVRRGHLKPMGRLGNTYSFRVVDVHTAAAERLAQTRSFHSYQGPLQAHTLTRGTPDVDALVPVQVAAEVAGVARSTARSWIRRGHLRVHGRRNRESIVRLGDVLTRARASGYKPRRKNPMP
ncbi:helix-turn-helix domain-containing protein [Ornithinimicrobium sp. Arc0846-15]|nr:helix-turn-helix domain-containing protein [Ornithinimicrobium laminariae]